jgi:hypothetical protein
MFVALGLGLAGCGSSNNSSGPLFTVDDGEPSVARVWNEVLLEGIRNDFARPTVHARNLWHISAAMYDAWAAFDDTASTWLLGHTQAGYECAFDMPAFPRDTEVAREEAISFAAYRIIRHRFANVPGIAPVSEFPEVLLDALGYDTAVTTEVPVVQIADDMIAALGFDGSNTSTQYGDGSPAALGNYIADCYIAYGLQDGSNEANAYAHQVYLVSQPPITVGEPGNPTIQDLDRWQQIQLALSIDQSGNVVDSTQRFVGPEWGAVDPFSLTDAEKSLCPRAGFPLPLYYDPGPPPYHVAENAEYRWTHTFVARVSSQLQDPVKAIAKSQPVQMIDISPNNLGNIQNYPTNFAERQTFYEQMLVDGTTADQGYTVNPATGGAYDEQLVPLVDYARAIAEFWADGPNSETPPGHWFVITNTISDHPQLVKRFEGAGPELGPLEWDVKVYFALGGAMHDAAIAAWGMKGCYDYIRPVSAIRAMADIAFESGTSHPDAIPLEPGRVEVVQAGDMIVKPGVDGTCPDAEPQLATPEDVGKIKLYAWVGPCAISNPRFDTAGVDWILAENWWPYQRPTFVTPPFAGYISGHSTYSRTAAELLTLFTGDPYFPGGKSEFPAPQNQFLVFEEGPSVDMVLEWATYIDASDQCSLSRIWGGIHPPADDMPGRYIGMELGPQAFKHARDYFNGLN